MGLACSDYVRNYSAINVFEFEFILPSICVPIYLCITIYLLLICNKYAPFIMKEINTIYSHNT